MKNPLKIYFCFVGVAVGIASIALLVALDDMIAHLTFYNRLENSSIYDTAPSYPTPLIESLPNWAAVAFSILIVSVTMWGGYKLSLKCWRFPWIFAHLVLCFSIGAFFFSMIVTTVNMISFN